LAVSAATGAGVPDVLRALLAAIGSARGTADSDTGAGAQAWHP
jgi:hypothetical protein